MKKGLHIAFLFLFFSLSAVAQKGKIEGKVTDSKNGSQLSGVSISVDSDKPIAVSNTDGYFVITVDAGKKYTIKLSSVGYGTKEISDVEVTDKQVVNLDIQMEPVSKTETAVVIRSSARKDSPRG